MFLSEEFHYWELIIAPFFWHYGDCMITRGALVLPMAILYGPSVMSKSNSLFFLSGN